MKTVRPLRFIFVFLLFPSLAFAQQKEPDTARRGPIFQLVGGLEQDWGTVKPERITRMLYVTNSGDDTLRLLDWRNSGGHVIGRIRNGVIAPGDTGTIEMLGAFETERSERPFIKAFTLVTNDPQKVQQTIRIKGRILPDGGIYPSTDAKNRMEDYGVFRSLKPGEETSLSVRVRATGESPLVVFPPLTPPLPAMTEDPLESPGYQCGVTTDMIDTVVLQPGEEREVTIRLRLEKDDTTTSLPGHYRITFPTSGIPRQLHYTIVISPYRDVLCEPESHDPLFLHPYSRLMLEKDSVELTLTAVGDSAVTIYPLRLRPTPNITLRTDLTDTIRLQPGERRSFHVWAADADLSALYFDYDASDIEGAFFIETSGVPARMVRDLLAASPPRWERRTLDSLVPGKEEVLSVSLYSWPDSVQTFYPAMITTTSEDFTIAADLTDSVRLRKNEPHKVSIRVSSRRRVTENTIIGELSFPTSGPYPQRYGIYVRRNRNR